MTTAYLESAGDGAGLTADSTVTLDDATQPVPLQTQSGETGDAWRILEALARLSVKPARGLLSSTTWDGGTRYAIEVVPL